MKIEVEIISKEMIKPSSPTPRHLRHHQLSFLDQLAPHAYIPFLYFYPLTNNTHATQTQISIHLKKSLSKILTHYYPLSGRVKDNRLIDCNDHGVPFYEARVKSHSLSDIATNPSLAELKYLLPFDAAEVTQVALGVQLNLFQCGGVATGLCLSHRIGDPLSCFTFVNNWASAARGDELVGPDFLQPRFFCPRTWTVTKG